MKYRLTHYESEYREWLENWVRWGRDRRDRPKSWGSIIGNLYVVKNRDAEPVPPRQYTNIQAAEKMEDIIQKIPELFRQSFVLHYACRCVLNGKKLFVPKSREGWRVLRISRSTYYARLNEAWRFVEWELENYGRRQTEKTGQK